MTSPVRYVVTLGETLGLFRNEVAGSLAHVSTLAVSVGGSESNVAIGLSRLGVTVAWVGRVGDDSLGQRVVREIRAEGVKVHGLVDSGAPTALMLKERMGAQTSRVWYYRGGSAGSRLTPDDIDPGLVEGASLLHVTGITPALSASARDAVFSAVDRARAANVPVSFDVNHRSRLWPTVDPTETYLALARQATLVFAGLDEGALLVGASDPVRMGQQLIELGPSHAVIKLGAHGAVDVSKNAIVEQAAVPVSVVDTVGAGDAFVAGYLADWLNDAPTSQSLRTAATAGAMVCTTSGDWEGMPFRADLVHSAGDDPVQR